MMVYDPIKPPVAKEWLGLTSADRVTLVERYHKQAGPRMFNLRAHATIHAAVENQAARGVSTPVRKTIRRLMAEGLDRHEALHAVGTVLAQVLRGTRANPSRPGSISARYADALDALTANGWLRGHRS